MFTINMRNPRYRELFTFVEEEHQLVAGASSLEHIGNWSCGFKLQQGPNHRHVFTITRCDRDGEGEARSWIMNSPSTDVTIVVLND